jgi:hypothetical protein
MHAETALEANPKQHMVAARCDQFFQTDRKGITISGNESSLERGRSHEDLFIRRYGRHGGHRALG